MAKAVGLAPKQMFEREGQTLRRKAAGYAHTRQFKRLRKVLRRQRTILGVLMRDVQRKMADLSDAAQVQLQDLLDRVARIHAQTASKTDPSGRGKLYALHAPEVECIGKGKAGKPYEFGVKTSLAVTHGQGLIVGARTFPGNPYDGHTLAAQLEQTSTLLQNLDVKPTTAIVDLGYRGADADIAPIELIHRGKSKRLTDKQRRWLKRRQAVEPVIGHVKQDHGLQRCWLKGSEGDALHAVLCAAAYNLRWLLRAIARKGLRVFCVCLVVGRADRMARLSVASAPQSCSDGPKLNFASPTTSSTVFLRRHTLAKDFATEHISSGLRTGRWAAGPKCACMSLHEPGNPFSMTNARNK